MRDTMSRERRERKLQIERTSSLDNSVEDARKGGTTGSASPSEAVSSTPPHPRGPRSYAGEETKEETGIGETKEETGIGEAGGAPARKRVGVGGECNAEEDEANYAPIRELLFGDDPEENEKRLCCQDNENWNQRFQDVLDKPDENPDDAYLKWEQLTTVNRDFVAAAVTYGKTIISELFLDEKDKSIKPREMGGVCGGKKFLWRGIMFKLADGSSGPYRGNDEAAAKGAGHDLKGATRYLATRIRGLHYALQCVIDYKGFRMTAQAQLPVDSSTLRYGTADGGKTIHNEDAQLDRMVKEAGKKLNLKTHVLKGKAMHSACDIEGHKGSDGRHYLLDFARSFPPESPFEVDHLSKILNDGTAVLVDVDIVGGGGRGVDGRSRASGGGHGLGRDGERRPRRAGVIYCTIVQPGVQRLTSEHIKYKVRFDDTGETVELPASRVKDRRRSVFWRMLRPELVNPSGDRMASQVMQPESPPPPQQVHGSSRRTKWKRPSADLPKGTPGLDTIHSEAYNEEDDVSTMPRSFQAAMRVPEGDEDVDDSGGIGGGYEVIESDEEEGENTASPSPMDLPGQSRGWASTAPTRRNANAGDDPGSWTTQSRGYTTGARREGGEAAVAVPPLFLPLRTPVQPTRGLDNNPGLNEDPLFVPPLAILTPTADGGGRGQEWGTLDATRQLLRGTGGAGFDDGAGSVEDPYELYVNYDDGLKAERGVNTGSSRSYNTGSYKGSSRLKHDSSKGNSSRNARSRWMEWTESLRGRKGDTGLLHSGYEIMESSGRFSMGANGSFNVGSGAGGSGSRTGRRAFALGGDGSNCSLSHRFYDDDDSVEANPEQKREMMKMKKQRKDELVARPDCDDEAEGWKCGALSPDALTAFSKTDKDISLRNQEVHDATSTMIDEIIPAFAKHLINLPPELQESLDLTVELHRHGINIRHLGKVRSEIPDHKNNSLLRDMMLIQMVARTLKNILRSYQRKWMKAEKSTSEQGMRMLVVNFLNLVTCAHPKSKKFWEETVAVGVMQRFGMIALTDFERQNITYVSVEKPHVLRPCVFNLIEMQGLVLKEVAAKELNKDKQPMHLEFLVSDIQEIRPIVRYMHILDYGGGVMLSMQAERLKKEGQTDARTLKRLQWQAKQFFISAYHSLPDDKKTRSALLSCSSCQFDSSRRFKAEDSGGADGFVENDDSGERRFVIRLGGDEGNRPVDYPRPEPRPMLRRAIDAMVFMCPARECVSPEEVLHPIRQQQHKTSVTNFSTLATEPDGNSMHSSLANTNPSGSGSSGSGSAAELEPAPLNLPGHIDIPDGATF